MLCEGVVTVSIERVGVVGAGQMGSGIAEVSAQAGADVVVYEPTEELITAGRNRITESLERGVSKGKLTEARARRGAGEADVHHRPRRPGRPPAGDRGGRRGRGRQGQDLRRTRRAHHRSRRRAGVEHVEHPDHENRCGDEESEPRARPALLQPGAGAAAGRAGQHAGHLRAARWRAPSSSRARCWASRWCAAATGPASSSTRCWCPTCCRRSGWPRPASPPSRTSTRPWSPGCRTRWARCGCPTSSASTR